MAPPCPIDGPCASGRPVTPQVNPVLAKFTLPRKDEAAMDSRDALDQLETIRLLMERSALYRRALGPICLAIGGLGGAAALAAYYLGIQGSTAFALWWLSTAAVALALAFFIARRQAIGVGEPFWSPPTRRVAAAVLPPLAAGALLSIPFLLGESWARRVVWLLPALWMVLYGCALHAAGFFMRRGIRLFGWTYLLAGSGLLLWWTCPLNQFPPVGDAHIAMGLGFSLGHFAYGAYLHFTEKDGTP